MKRISIIIAVMLAMSCKTAFGWGRMGHDAVAYIAECNLSPKALKRVTKILDGHSIVYYASWMDEIRATPPYKHTTYWHTGPVNECLEYDESLLTSKGNVVHALETVLDKLDNWKTLDDSTLAVSVRQVVHMVGDMHCPVHAKLPDINGKYNIVLSGKDVSYHAVWDSQIIEQRHKWHYTEWRQQLDRLSKKEKKIIGEGSIRDWFHDTALVTRQIYDAVPRDSEQGTDFLNAMSPIAERQILKAGYRLARVLNEIFG